MVLFERAIIELSSLTASVTLEWLGVLFAAELLTALTSTSLASSSS
jgi:hypothetical protein